MEAAIEGRFSGHVAVVTGTGSGLGAATAKRFALEGAAVAGLDIDIAAGLVTAEAIEAAGGRAAAFEANVSDPDSVGEAIAAAAAALGPATVAVNCAGIGRFGHSHEFDPGAWERIIAVNLSGTFYVCRAVIPAMLEAGTGSIVNVASNAGFMGQPYSAAYCASKAGVVNLTKALAAEYIRTGIRVNGVAPGGIDTPLQNDFAESFPPDADMKALRKFMTPLGSSRPEEIAGVIAFVASDEARYMIGAVVNVDGGLTT